MWILEIEYTIQGSYQTISKTVKLPHFKCNFNHVFNGIGEKKYIPTNIRFKLFRSETLLQTDFEIKNNDWRTI